MEDSAAKLELELGARVVALRHLVSAASMFARLINEVARSYLGGQRDAVQWIVDVQPGSVKLPIRAEAPADQIAPFVLPELVNVIVNGLVVIEARPERPEHFSDRALEHAKALGNLSSAELPISVRNGHALAVLTKRIPANVDDVLGAPVVGFGTVEGLLEAFNIHGPSPTFSVYDLLTGRGVPCRFTERVTVEDLRPTIGRRVSVRGPIRFRGGERTSVDAFELTVFPSEDELPSPSEVQGLLKVQGRLRA